MILDSLFGVSLVVSVAFSQQAPAPTVDPVGWHQLSQTHKQAKLLPLVSRATDCIVNAVSADPRFTHDIRPDQINTLIVDAMPSCAPVLRRMIDTYDRMYGAGSGRAFLLGPYLDVLPSALVRQVSVPTR